VDANLSSGITIQQTLLASQLIGGSGRYAVHRTTKFHSQLLWIHCGTYMFIYLITSVWY